MLGFVALGWLPLWVLLGFGFFGGAFEVEGEQTLENLSVAQVCRPTVGGGHGGIEFLVGQIQPGRALVVEVGQRPLLQLRRAVRVACLEARIANEAN